MPKSCAHTNTQDLGGKTVCMDCAQLLSGGASMGTATIDPKPAGFRILNIHGHGVRRGPAICSIPTGMQVAFWVPDQGRLNAAQMRLDSGGTPADNAVELATGSTYNYSTFALGDGDDINARADGARMRDNLIDAIAAAISHGSAAWVVNTQRLRNSTQGTGVVTLSYIFATISQVQNAKNYQWRINWVCCREELGSSESSSSSSIGDEKKKE